jgi:hypothetical protein
MVYGKPWVTAKRHGRWAGRDGRLSR